MTPSTLVPARSCSHRRRDKHTVCASCYHSFDYCHACHERRAPECCPRCQARQWFELMHAKVEVAA